MIGSMTQHNEDKEDGFTLIEILVVIVIIGILVGLAVLFLWNQTRQANDVAVESDMRNMINVTEPLHNEYYDKGKDEEGVFSKQIQIRGVSSAQFNNPDDPKGKGNVEIQVKDKEQQWEVMGKVSLSDGVKAYIVRMNPANANPADNADGYTIYMYHENGKDHTVDSPLRWSNQFDGGGKFFELDGD